ncbi:MAG: copper amine oxidase N-terminal domain-containing protein [Candidatus Eremiobacteraeota bacterium]|nr:copper amine oxidase N-terminal domain-containing protein [Candidatus Eremiobacteraeota bacterium]
MKPQTPGWRTLTITAVIALLVSAALAFSKPVELRVDGQRIVTDVPPVTQDHEVFVPLRAIAEALGADTRFESKHGSNDEVEVIRGDQTLRLSVGKERATLNGAQMTLRHAPFRVRGRLMIGMHSISRAFSVKTRYDRRTSRIDVDSPGVIEAGAQVDTDTTPAP